MGANEWREEGEWPLARTKWREFFFHSDGEAHRLEREGGLSEERPADEPCDTFVYDPEDPVPTCGGPLCCSPLYSRGGPFDRSCVEKRLDVLTYSSPYLDDDFEVTGEVIVRLWASSSAVDTDWTAKLVDVGPELARNVTEGIIRARYRSGPFREEMLVPGEVYEYEIRLPPTSNVFKRGHQLRIEISSSNFPRFDPNPNTGGEIAVETRSEIAHQRIYHDRAHPSCLLLPTIPAR
jgi:putative CocE/NonD family hydrolase